MSTTFYHFTCDHSRAAIGDTGHLQPLRDLTHPAAYEHWATWRRPLLDMVWLTEIDVPLARALGLTSFSVGCDRTAHRYRAYGYTPVRYTAVRRDLPKRLRDDLESADGAMPGLWWVAYTPVPVVYDVYDPILTGGTP